MFDLHASEAILEQSLHFVYPDPAHRRFGFEGVAQEERTGAEEAAQASDVSQTAV
jgi:hypothetical protein